MHSGTPAPQSTKPAEIATCCSSWIWPRLLEPCVSKTVNKQYRMLGANAVRGGVSAQPQQKVPGFSYRGDGCVCCVCAIPTPLLFTSPSSRRLFGECDLSREHISKEPLEVKVLTSRRMEEHVTAMQSMEEQVPAMQRPAALGGAGSAFTPAAVQEVGGAGPKVVQHLEAR